jgi:anti-anti-sigma factor
MQISIDDAGMTAKVKLDGRLDSAGTQAIAERLAQLSEQKHGLVVDLAGVSYVTSAGIRQLLMAAKTLTRRGGRLVLLNPNKTVEEILAVSATNSLIPVTRSEKQAQAVLAAALSG